MKPDLMIFHHPSRCILPGDALGQWTSVVECEMVLGRFTQCSGINGVVHVGMIMKWGTIAVRCQHGIHKIEEEVHITFRHLVTVIQEISQLELHVQFVREPIVRAALWA